MTSNGAGTGIVGGQGQIELVVELVEHKAQVTASATDVILDIKGVSNAHVPGGLGQKLHHAEGPFAGNRFRVEVAFSLDDSLHERCFEAIEVSIKLYDILEWPGVRPFLHVEAEMAGGGRVGKVHIAVGIDVTIDVSQAVGAEKGQNQNKTQLYDDEFTTLIHKNDLFI